MYPAKNGATDVRATDRSSLLIDEFEQIAFFREKSRNTCSMPGISGTSRSNISNRISSARLKRESASNPSAAIQLRVSLAEFPEKVSRASCSDIGRPASVTAIPSDPHPMPSLSSTTPSQSKSIALNPLTKSHRRCRTEPAVPQKFALQSHLARAKGAHRTAP